MDPTVKEATLPSMTLLLLSLSISTSGSDGSHTVRRGQMLMGTLVQVTAVADDEATAAKAAATALGEVRRLEERLSTWIPTSDLSQVNVQAGRGPVKVSPETLSVVKSALQVATLTEGAFNIAIGPAVENWRQYEQAGLPDQAELDRLKPFMDLSQIRIDEVAGTLFLAQSGMRVDVGGIGKGFAADRAIEVMRTVGATGAS
jgi:thiamine biosynthesis lipoprotein